MQTGLFTGKFESTDDGRTQGEALMDEGADIIMPVAGTVGLGTTAAVKERGNAYIIGVDSDWYLTAPDYKDIVLTSVLKNMNITTKGAIQQAMEGTFADGVIVGTLENGGVGLAPFHDRDSMVPAELKTELDQIKADIIAGTIATAPGQEPAPAAPEPPAAAVGGSVGIVLPTKNEPRWIQDEARFKEALEAAGYEVEILFSEGSSANTLNPVVGQQIIASCALSVTGIIQQFDNATPFTTGYQFTPRVVADLQYLPGCTVGVEGATWGTVKGLYRD